MELSNHGFSRASHGTCWRGALDSSYDAEREEKMRGYQGQTMSDPLQRGPDAPRGRILIKKRPRRQAESPTAAGVEGIGGLVRGPSEDLKS